MSKTFFLWILIITGLQISGCAQTPTRIVFLNTVDLEDNFLAHGDLKWTLQSQHDGLTKADVKNDFQRAISKKDFRFVAIMGNGMILPGISKYIQKHTRYSERIADSVAFDYADKYHFKSVAGTSDVVTLGKADVQTLAYKYAETFNEMMLKYIAANHISSGR